MGRLRKYFMPVRVIGRSASDASPTMKYRVVPDEPMLRSPSAPREPWSTMSVALYGPPSTM